MPDIKKIATFSVFGYPDAKNPGKYLFTHEQAKAFAKKCEVHAFDLGADTELFKEITEEYFENIKVFRFPKIIRSNSDIFNNWSTFIKFRKRLTYLLSRNNYDYLLLSFIDPRYLLFLFPWKHYRIAITAHGFDALIMNDSIHVRIVKNIILKKANLIFPVSDFTADCLSLLSKSTYLNKIKVVYNGINRNKLATAIDLSKEAAKKTLNFEPETKVILSISNLVLRKGIDIVIRADKILKDKGYSFVHIIAGNGLQKKYLTQLVYENDLSEQIIFIDRLSDREIGTYYKSADVFAVISRSLLKHKQVEGFGIVFAEAGYLGVPVVAGKSGGVPSVVQHNKTGFLVDPESDYPEIETAVYIEKLLTDQLLWNQMSKDAEKFIHNNFDWDLNTSKVLQLMKISGN